MFSHCPSWIIPELISSISLRYYVLKWSTLVAGKIKDIAFVKDPDGYWIEIFDTASIAKSTAHAAWSDAACMIIPSL